MKKTLITISILVALGIGVFASAQTAWIGTSWIGSGEVVSSTNLQSNLDYLFDEKAPIPADCDGVTEFLGWFNGGWTCRGTGAPNNCSFNGTTVAHQDTVVAYQNVAVASDSTCQQEVRTCSNGTLSGSYQFASCSVAPPSACVFDGAVIQHGDTVTAYETTTVAAGETCGSETRTCTNGSLSGSYTHATCEPAATECVFNGRVVDEGDSKLAFLETTAPFGDECTSEVRTCTDGTLSGSYEYTFCNVDAPSTLNVYRSDVFSQSGSSYVFEGDLRWVSDRQDGGGGTNIQTGDEYLDFASDNTTLTRLCELQGYTTVINTVGFRTYIFASGEGSLAYSGGAWVSQESTSGETVMDEDAYIVCGR